MIIFNKIIVYLSFLLGCLTPSGTQNSNYSANYWQIKQINNTYWFVSPNGELEFLNLIDRVKYEELGNKPPHYLSLNKNLHERVIEYGFKGIGAWSSDDLHDKKIPFCKDLNLSKYYPIELIKEKEWEINKEPFYVYSRNEKGNI
jgi:hypothetical protein